MLSLEGARAGRTKTPTRRDERKKPFQEPSASSRIRYHFRYFVRILITFVISQVVIVLLLPFRVFFSIMLLFGAKVFLYRTYVYFKYTRRLVAYSYIQSSKEQTKRCRRSGQNVGKCGTTSSQSLELAKLMFSTRNSTKHREKYETIKMAPLS